MSYQALGNCDQHWQSNTKNMDSDNVTCSISGLIRSLDFSRFLRTCQMLKQKESANLSKQFFMWHFPLMVLMLRLWKYRSIISPQAKLMFDET